jgi:hypothetical protein
MFHQDDVESGSQAAADEIGGGKKVAKKVVKKKAAPAKKAAAKSEGKSTKKAADANVVTLAQLAKEAKIEPSSARVKLRKAELENPGRWQFDKGSKAEKEARKALGL